MPAPSSQEAIALLPEGFPHRVPQPKLRIGDQVVWYPRPAQDFGTVTGLQYAPAEHLQSWGWRYIIWLDPKSPSHAWTCTDTAWEEDLELQPLEMAANEQVGDL